MDPTKSSTINHKNVLKCLIEGFAHIWVVCWEDGGALCKANLRNIELPGSQSTTGRLHSRIETTILKVF